MNFIQEVLNLLERKQDKKKLDLKRDWFEFGRTRPSSVGNPLYTPKMNPHAIRYDDLKCNIISGLVSGTGTEHTLPMWSVIDKDNCDVQTMIDSIFSQDAGATEGLVSGNFRVTGDTVLEGNLLVLGTQTIVESTIVQVADNIMRINSGGGAFDAGIEVIQPSGTKTWAWDNGKGLWSTFDDSILTKDIIIEGVIKQDGEALKNVVNEAEGLASNDNDQSYATVAAIIDWTDQMDLDVSADTGTPLDILLNLETLQIRGGSNITTNADGAEKIRIDLDDDITVNSVTSKNLTLVGAPGAYNVTSIVNTIADAVDPNATLATVKAIINYVDQERDFISNVSLTGNDLTFTGVNNAFSGVVDLSSIGKTYSIKAGISSGDGSVGYLELLENGVPAAGVKYPRMSEWINIDSDGVNEIQISHKELASPILPTITNVNLGNGDTFVEHSYEFDNAGHVNAIHTVNYTLPTITAGSNVIANPGNPTADLTSIEIDGVSYGIASIAVDGNDFIDSVTLTGSDLIFTGSGDAFSGTIDLSQFLDNADEQTLSFDQDTNELTISNGNTVDLSSLNGGAGNEYILQSATGGFALVNAATSPVTIVDIVKLNPGPGITVNSSIGANNEMQFQFRMQDVERTDTDTSEAPDHTETFTVIDTISTNSRGQVTDVNTKTITLPASGTGADGVITDVALNGNDLKFIGSNGGFNGIVDLSGYANAAETVTSLSINANVLTYTDENNADTDIDLSLYLDDTNLARLVSGALDAATGIATFTRDDATTFTLDLSSLLDTDTNDIDYVSRVNLNGSNLEFTGVGNAFAGSIDLSGFSTTDTDTNYDLSSRQNINDVDITLSGSDSSLDVLKLVAGTNIKLTDDGSNNITIDAIGSSDTTVACQSGIGALNSTQSLTSTYASIQDGATFPLGFKNVSTETRHYALTWTIEYGMSGTTGFKAFDTEVINNGTTQLIEYKDSAYMASEHPVSRTYTYTTGLLPDGTLEIRVKGDTSLTINKAHLTIIVNDCEANASGEITVLPSDGGGFDDPRGGVYTAEQYVDGSCNLSGNTIDVTGNLQIGDVFQDKGRCFIVTGPSASNTGINITNTFPDCEQCNQLVPRD